MLYMPTLPSTTVVYLPRTLNVEANSDEAQKTRFFFVALVYIYPVYMRKKTQKKRP